MREIEQLHPDLIILDYIFGTEKTGWQMLQKLKMTRQTATIPIIICTIVATCAMAGLLLGFELV